MPPRDFERRAEQGFKLDSPARLDILKHGGFERAEPRSDRHAASPAHREMHGVGIRQAAGDNARTMKT